MVRGGAAGSLLVVAVPYHRAGVRIPLIEPPPRLGGRLAVNGQRGAPRKGIALNVCDTRRDRHLGKRGTAQKSICPDACDARGDRHFGL